MARAVPILYGYPSDIVWDAAERGLVVLGGCVIYGDDPTWHCDQDQITWNGPDLLKAIEDALLQAELGRDESAARSSRIREAIPRLHP